MRRFYCIAQYFVVLSLTSFLVVSCSKDPVIPLDAQKQIVTFKIDTVLGMIDETNHTVIISVPGSTDLAHVQPEIAISKNAVISPAAGTQVDLTKPVTYTVTAQDQSKQTYVVTAKKIVNLQNRISSFEITSGAYTYKGVINDSTFTVKIGAPFTKTGNVDPTKVATSVAVSAGATIVPAVNAVVDFTTPVKYKVTAPNGEVQEYTVSVLNNETDLTGFDVPLNDFVEGDLRKPKMAITGTENGLWGEEVTGLTAPFAIFYALETENVTSLPIKNVKLSQGATISPAADAPQDFTNDVVYTVTSQYGNTQQYTIRAFKKKIIMRYEFEPTSFMVSASGNLEEYMSDQDIKAAWLVGSDGTEYSVTVQPATRYAWGYVTTCFTANTGALLPGTYRFKVKLANDVVVSLTHRFYSY